MNGNPAPLNAPESRVCPGCGDSFHPAQKTQRWCGSADCKLKRNQARFRRWNNRKVAARLRDLADELEKEVDDER